MTLSFSVTLYFLPSHKPMKYSLQISVESTKYLVDVVAVKYIPAVLEKRLMILYLFLSIDFHKRREKSIQLFNYLLLEIFRNLFVLFL